MVEPGTRVQVEYVGRFETGSVFATSDPETAAEHGLVSEDGESASVAPLAFTVGRGEVIEGLDEAVRELSEGEEATVRVPPEKGYGEHEDRKVRTYDPETFESMVGQQPEIGLHVQAENDLHGDVTAVSEDAVEVDFNHELAGKTLVFDLRVAAVE